MQSINQFYTNPFQNLLIIGNMNSAGTVDLEGEHTIDNMVSKKSSKVTLKNDEFGGVSKIGTFTNRGFL